MRKTLIALCILFVGFNAQAQGAGTEADKAKAAKAMEMMSKKVDMDVNEELFTAATTNTYVSESPKAVIMAMIVPETYEASKAKMNENNSDQFKVSDRGEKEVNGVKVLFMEGTSESEGVTLNNTVYCVKYDEETCIMFIGMVEVGADKKYIKAITNAANSVIKKY
jgi:hypothetical protein